MTDRRQEFFKLWPVGGRAGDFFLKHALASRRLQIFQLGGEVLGVGRDAGIAENHSSDISARTLRSSSAMLKKPCFSAQRITSASLFFAVFTSRCRPMSPPRLRV